MTILSNSKEEAILEAAETEFMEKGYDGAKTETIAKTAGVTHAMLHYYFRTKSNLFNRVFNDKIGMMMQSIISAFQDSNGPFLARIQKGIEAHFDFLIQNPNIPRFVVNELISKPERLSIISDKVKDLIASIVISMQKELNEQIAANKINEIKISDLLIDIASVNVFVFITLPIVRNITNYPYSTEKAFLEARKKESVRIIMDRLLNKNK